MRPNYWKLLGVAGVAGVAATGVVVARRRRAAAELEPDEIRERLHQRLAEARQPAAAEPWWKTAVVYQIYPRSFADSDGDGMGDLQGIISRLDHLSALGVDVIWLSPVYPSPQDDNGYDIADYQGIEPRFGTLEDFDALLAAVHERGMKLVMDLVVNHTSAEHAWFKESRSSRESPKRDWYWWRERPNNWRSFFSGSAWELDEATGEHYLHLFARSMPDLNWENPEVREAVYSMMRWWLDRGVDGFRMDVINMISKDPALPDAREPGVGMMPDGSEHFINGPRIHEFMQEMHRSVFAGRPEPTLTVGEMPGVTIEEARLFTDPARGEVDMVFQFEHVNLDQGATKWDVTGLRLTDLKASFGRWQEGLAGDGLELAVLEQPRPAARRLALRRRRPRAPRALGEDARHRPAPAPRDAVRLPGRGARDDERALRPHRRLPRHRVAQPPRRGGRARRRRGHGARRACARWAATTRARRCSGTRASTPASPPASRGSPSTRTSRRSTRRRRAPIPTPSSTTTGG